MRSAICPRSVLLATVVALCALPAAAAPARVLDVHHDSTTVSEPGGGDGIISPGDSLSVTESVFSSDTAGDITNINGALTTATANVTIPQPASAFPTLSF
jgi:hypothetical protein